MSERAYELGQAQTITFPGADNDSAVDRLGEAISRHLRLEGLTRAEAVTTVNATLQQLGVDDEQAAMALVQLARPNDQAPADSGMRIHFGTLGERITLLAWYLSKLAARRPLIVIADDLSEDTAAQETIQRVLERRVGPILCLATARFGLNDDDVGAAAVASCGSTSGQRLSDWRHSVDPTGPHSSVSCWASTPRWHPGWNQRQGATHSLPFNWWGTGSQRDALFPVSTASSSERTPRFEHRRP